MQKNLLACTKITQHCDFTLSDWPYNKPTSFVLVCICDQKWDYKLELSEINQRFSGNTNIKPDQTANALLNTVSQKAPTQYTAKPSTSPLCVSPRELSCRTNELFKDHPSKHSWGAKECDSVLNALVCDPLLKKTFVPHTLNYTKHKQAQTPI